MVSSYTVVNPSSAGRASERSACFVKLARSHATLGLPPRCRSRSVWAARPASLAVSARQSSYRQSLVKVGVLCIQTWGCQASKTASFGHELFPFKRRSLRTSWLPVSQRLKPQSSMPARFRTSPFASASAASLPCVGSQGQRASMRVASSKQKRAGSQQTPNPSFKRTCLRQAA